MSNLLTPRLVSVSQSCGCTLTRASITPLTADLIEAQASIEYQTLYTRWAEAAAVGVVPDTLYDLLTSRIKEVDKSRLHVQHEGPTSVIAPFRFRRRDRNWASSTFRILSSVATSGAGVGSVLNSSRDLLVDVGGGPYQSAFQHPSRYFLPGNYLAIEHQSGATVAITVNMRITSVADTSSTQATVTATAPFTNAQWTALTNADKLKYQPAFGVVTLLTNSVSPYESWCYSQPTNINKELVTDWFQHSRFARCTEKEYEEMLGKILRGEINPYMQDWLYNPVAERNKQMRMEFDKQWMNSVFYGQRISPAQVDDIAAASFTDLPAVVDPEDPTCILERKANAVGIYQQMVEGSRKTDFQGGNLNLDLILQIGFSLRKNREVRGGSAERIDLMMPRGVKDQFDTILIRYIKDRYGVDTSKWVQDGKTVDQSLVTPGWDYTTYSLPKDNIELAIYTHQYFDRRVEDFTYAGPGQSSIAARGRWIMAIDWSDIDINVAETTSVHREYKGETTANASATWSCVMKMNTKNYDLEDTFWGVGIGDISRHYLFENFNDSCPTLTNRPCSPVT